MAAACMTAGAAAQVAGRSDLGTAASQGQRIVAGRSARHSILGKTVYNESGEAVATIQDLIVDPDNKVSYLILSGGGLFGTEAHSVALPADQMREEGGRIVFPGATRRAVRAMPAFRYAASSANHDRLVVDVRAQLERSKARVFVLEKQAAALTGAQKLRVDQQVADIANGQAAVEAKLGKMEAAGTTEWWQFEDELRSATTRLRKTIARAIG